MPRLVLAILAASLAAVPALAQGVAPPAVKPGDRWVYNATDGKRSLKVESVAADGTIDASIDAPGLSGLSIRYTSEWNVLLAPVPMLGNIQYERYSPPICLMPPAPWRVGQAWSCDANWSSASYSGTVHVVGKIAAAEKISVPAGAFDTLRVELNVGGTQAACWYAAKVANWALCKSALPDYNYALVSYQLN